LVSNPAVTLDFAIQEQLANMIMASEQARDGTVRALQDQYHRLLVKKPIVSLTLKSRYVITPLRSFHSPVIQELGCHTSFAA
jgi:hypothetical protein